MSLVDFANTNKGAASGAFDRLAGMEHQRNQANESLKQQHSARQASTAGNALGMGVGVGMLAGGPAGLAVGAGVMLLGSLF